MSMGAVCLSLLLRVAPRASCVSLQKIGVQHHVVRGKIDFGLIFASFEELELRSLNFWNLEALDP